MKRFQIIQRLNIEGTVFDSMFHVEAESMPNACKLAFMEASELDDQPHILSICECNDKNVITARMKTRVVKL